MVVIHFADNNIPALTVNFTKLDIVRSFQYPGTIMEYKYGQAK